VPDHEPARDYIHAMIGHRTRISEAERDILHQLLNTPAIRARFPSLTREELCNRRLVSRAGPADTAPEVASPEDRVAVSRTPPARLLLKSSAAERAGHGPRGEWPVI
jgi:hypothetical protein